MAREGDEREERDVYQCEKADGQMIAAVERIQGVLEIYPEPTLPERGNILFPEHLFIRDTKHHIPLKIF